MRDELVDPGGSLGRIQAEESLVARLGGELVRNPRAERGACERAHDPFHGLSDDERHARMTWSLHEEAVARGDTENPFYDMNI